MPDTAIRLTPDDDIIRHDVLGFMTSFGLVKVGDIRIESEDPDQLEAVAEAFLAAARDLRAAQVDEAAA